MQSDPLPRPVLCLLLAAIAAGCGSMRPPIGTSLSDLSFESRHFDGLVLSHTEFVSLGGQLPIPDVGMIYHYEDHPSIGAKLRSYSASGHWPDKDLPPSTVLILSRDHSFRLIGESQDPAGETLTQLEVRTMAVRDSIDELRDLAVAGTQLATRLAAEHKSLDGETDKSSARARELSQHIDALDRERLAADKRIEEGKAQLRRLLSKPGIIIARWQREREQRRGLEAGDEFHARAASDSADSGLAVLGGLRVCALAVGDDFKQMVAQLDPTDASVLRHAAVNTYLLQARFVSYISDRRLTQELDVGAKLTKELLTSKNPLDVIDAISISYYAKSFEDLGNRGDIGPMRWSKEPFCFVSGVDLYSLDHLSESLQSCPPDAVTVGGWTTIVAQIVHPGLLAECFGGYQAQLADGKLPPHAEESHRTRCSFGRCDRYPELMTPELGRDLPPGGATQPAAPKP